MKYFLIFLFSSLLLTNCKTQKPLDVNEYDGPKLIFGTFGGFAGSSNEHTLLPDGQLLNQSTKARDRRPNGKIDKKVATQMIKNFKTLGFNTLELHDPGNLTYFIEFSENGEKHKLSWGRGAQKVPAELKTYYQTLYGLVKSLKAPDPKM